MFADIEEVVEFLEEVIAGLLADQEVRTFGEVMVPVFDIFQGRVKDLDLCHLLLYSYLEILVYFSRQKDIAKVWAMLHLLQFCMSRVNKKLKQPYKVVKNSLKIALSVGSGGAHSAQRS